VVEQSTVALHRVSAVDFNTAERPRPPLSSATIQHRVRGLHALYAFALYLAFSIIFFGRALPGHLSDLYFGIGVDPGLMMWSLVWWPHAIAHGLNPLLTKVIWAPLGYNLAWSTSITLGSLLASPFTVTFGPVATYNVLCLITLPIDAFCAFLLCRHIVGDYPAALLGGYIFGFSPFMLGQLTSGHLQMLIAFPVPLCIYVTLLRNEARISQRIFIFLLSSLLVVQFLLSLEIFATMTMFGAFGLLLTWSFGSDRHRKRTLDLLLSLACAYGIALIVVSPYLYYFFTYSVRIGSDSTAAFFSVDPLNLLIPTTANELGRLTAFNLISATFVGGWTGEAGAYISLPLLLIAGAYAYRHWHELGGKLLMYCVAATIVLSLGPILHINLPIFSFRIALPWWILAKLPLLKNAYTVRFPMYTSLLLAIISSCYLARDVSTAVKAMLAVGVILLNLPNTSASYWLRPLDTPEFFKNSTYQRYLSKEEIVLILPYSYTGNSMLWQAQTYMYFDIAGGTTQPPPSEFRRWPIFSSLTKRGYVPDPGQQLKAFAAAHHISAIIVTDTMLPTWQNLLSTLDAHPVKAEGVSIYRSPVESTPDIESTWHSLRSRFDTDRLTTLVMGAEKYLSQGGDLDSLTVHKAEESAQIPRDELIGPPILFAPGVQDYSNQNRDPHFIDGVWVGRSTDGLVGIGEETWYTATALLLEKLRPASSKIYFPYPYEVGRTAPGRGSQEGWLMLTFTRAQLSQAAALLSARKEPPNLISRSQSK
jgi:hypothetical protein